MPKLLPFLPKIELSEGSSFRFLCQSISGSKPINYKWIKNGVNLGNLKSNSEIENILDMTLLNLKNVKRSDHGNYSCIASNAFGSDIKSTILHIKGLVN